MGGWEEWGGGEDERERSCVETGYARAWKMQAPLRFFFCGNTVGVQWVRERRRRQ